MRSHVSLRHFRKVSHSAGFWYPVLQLYLTTTKTCKGGPTFRRPWDGRCMVRGRPLSVSTGTSYPSSSAFPPASSCSEQRLRRGRRGASRKCAYMSCSAWISPGSTCRQGCLCRLLRRRPPVSSGSSGHHADGRNIVKEDLGYCQKAVLFEVARCNLADMLLLPNARLGPVCAFLPLSYMILDALHG